MKKSIFTAILVSMFFVSNAQSKDSVATDSTALISIKDYNQFVETIVSELPAKHADVIRNYWNQLLMFRVQQYNAKQKSLTKKSK